MKRYNPKDIEARWQQVWAEQQTFHVEVDKTKPKKYIIDMFPYPSGAAMHVGHVRNFTISDVLSQYHRQKGYNVLHTMGWDTFGLPAENYAIKTGTPPAVSTKANIANFKKQLTALGMSYDWGREVTTSEPEYYKWTQWIFTKLHEAGLAYQDERAQWWCPECKTVLANEQVVNGCCWRHEDTPVIKKNLKQWFFKITDYADELLAGIDDLDWPEKIKTMQRNWIGKSKGAEITFQIADSDKTIKVFTTRPDTIFGATGMLLAPEHELSLEIATDSQKSEVSEYVLAAQAKSDIERQENKEKTGVFTGAFAISPASGEQIPIWVADYVLAGYGSGAIMMVPAHDERDYEFAQKHGFKIIDVVTKPEGFEGCYGGEGLMQNSGQYNGISSSEMREKIVADLGANAQEKINFKMRDWLISRQRYWGAPIPIIHCPEHGAVNVPEKDLPVVLPEVTSFEPTGEGSVLKGVTDWVQTTCPVCGGPAERETDTMDGYACSSWYFLRYADPNNAKHAWNPDIANYWLPVDYYCGGDHAVSHLLYSRFWMYFFADQGWIEKTRREPVGKLVYNGYILAHDGQKMSKSKGNVVNPDDLIEQGYGADSVRLFEMFIAPYEQNTSWNTNGVPGTFRFLQRYWTLVQEYLASEQDDKTDEAVLKTAHKAIYKTSDQLEKLLFNNAVSSLMETINELYKIKAETNYAGSTSWRFALESITKLLAPFAPHITEEIWQMLGHTDSVHIDNWPVHNPDYLIEDTVTIAVQVNGKVRGSVVVPAEATQEEVEQEARANERIAAYLQEAPKKVIYVPGRLISFVV